MLAVMAALAADPLIDIRTVIPDVVLDVRYASRDNMMGRAVYPSAKACLRKSTAEKLAKAARTLREKGYRLVVYDAYRPLSVQKLLWEKKPDARFVANPAKGSMHNRGAAVDAGLADREGRALSMPSGFDEFTPRASHGAKGVPEAEAGRARLLKEAMEGAGLKALGEEWWHYSDPAAKSWPLLDVPLEQV